MTFCAIDFGTSNSAVAVPQENGEMGLVNVEGTARIMPTAAFYQVEGRDPHEEPLRLYGRAAVAAYLERREGRLMRSMKSILGSTLVTQRTELGAGHSVRYVDVVSGYLRHLKLHAEHAAGAEVPRVVLGRPVFFVDDDPVRDAQAQDTLRAAAIAIGFKEVSFQYEPIAAALDYETRLEREELVLVADVGGGTSDFSLVRVGPRQRDRLERKEDVLGSHGVHIAGTDFDRQIDLETILPLCGYGSLGPGGRGREPREVPSRVYFDLATWHLINTVYAPQRVDELRRMRSFYGDAFRYGRLMRVVELQLGHALLGQAEAAKIAVSEGGQARAELDDIETGLAAVVERERVEAAIERQMNSIADAAQETLRLAGVRSEQVHAIYFTGGSTGFRALVDRIATTAPHAAVIRGDRHASVAQGLALFANQLFSPATS